MKIQNERKTVVNSLKMSEMCFMNIPTLFLPLAEHSHVKDDYILHFSKFSTTNIP